MEMDTRAVVEHHCQALLEGDLEGAVADYTEDSALMTAGNVIRGVAALRGFYRSALERELRPGAAKATIDTFDVSGEYALLTWRTSFEGGEITFAADTYHVHDGKIVMHTSAAVTRL